MSNEDAISELLLQWEERRQQGETLTAEELCRDCPEYAQVVRERLGALQAIYQVLNLDVTRPDRPGGIAVERRPRVGNYEILDELGRGAMGVVFRARQVPLDRIVALKMILAGSYASTLEKDRFWAEARAVAQVKHPHVVQILEYGEAEGRPFFSQEYIEGGTLAALCGGKPLAPRRAAELLEMLALGVQAVHDRGVVHRDLKPQNVLMTADGLPKIADFGLARQTDAVTVWTKSTDVLGTPNYMAPEQAAGKARAVGPAADVYALGAILYYLLTGRPPFTGATMEEILRRVQNDDPVPPRRRQRNVPQPLETICLKCLAKDPRKRYTSGRELAERLRLFLDGKPIPDRPAGWLRRSWRTVRRHPAVLAFTLLLTTVAALLFVLNYLSSPERILERLQGRLARGEAAVLVEETGPPRWYRWRMGEDVTKVSALPREPLFILSGSIALVELLPDPVGSSYRFSAQVRHDDGAGDTAVGIYFGHSTGAGPLCEEHYFCVLSYADHGMSKGKAIVRLRDCGERRGEIVVNRDVPTRLGRPLDRVPVGGVSGPWRELVVERTPSEIRAFCDGVLLTGTNRRGLLKALSPADMEVHTRFLFLGCAPGAGITPRFAPREGLGLYVNHGSASFRRVVVQPLSGETEPQ
jgi:serine/threonine-protein kinase